MYLFGFHPLHTTSLADATTFAPMISRIEAGVKYYFIDYGISSYFPAGSKRELVLGIAGHDQDVPELSNNVPYNPFKVDIFTIGNVLRDELQAVGSRSLVDVLVLVSFLCRITPTWDSLWP